uniref:hypothetical protein n=1 Tax=Helicobacter cholecystus TaxID=45498 RepID=UPI00131519BD
LLLGLLCLSLFLYKKYGPQCLGIIFFALPWATLTRALGFPDNPDFWEKGLGIYIISGICGTFSLWLLFLKDHQKLYQKILFILFSLCLFFCFYVGIQESVNINGILKYIFQGIIGIGAINSFIFLPIAYLFFCLGEFIIFLILCYEILPKHSKSPTPKES